VDILLAFFVVGVLAYGDDLVLLAPSASATRRLFKICDEFGESYAVRLYSTLICLNI
jgi:hypothetical protein